jgi:hypothetical protein
VAIAKFLDAKRAVNEEAGTATPALEDAE